MSNTQTPDSELLKLSLIAKMAHLLNEIREAFPENTDEEILCITTGYANRVQ